LPKTSISVSSVYLNASLSLVFSRLIIISLIPSISILIFFCATSFVFSDITLPFLSNSTLAPSFKNDTEPSLLKIKSPIEKPPSDVGRVYPPTTSPSFVSGLYLLISPNLSSASDTFS